MKNRIAAVLLSIILITTLFATDMPPKREFRAVWISTVGNIDWPSSKYDSDATKKADLKAYIEKLADSGCNAVLFQVRCACDAMYNSPYDPWSYWFSGQQGTGPSTDWDPLSFVIEEAHNLGMELHAWVNPYRAVKTPSMFDNSNYVCDDHVSKQHPDWILKFSDIYILDPGLPEVRDYIETVLMDIVTRYDVDGLHMDDYFYPYSGITDEDTATFANYSRGFEDVDDWRRDNINILVEDIMDSINVVKPWVKWGISPFGIWKPGVPSGITGMNAYDIIYCDPIAWLQEQTVDYITPQCYWAFGGGQDYGTLIPWWAEQAQMNNRHFYPGQAIYRVYESDWDADEIPNQVRLNRETDNCDGSVYFTGHSFYRNSKGVIDSLKYDLYSSPSLWPIMNWKDSIAPAMPDNIQLVFEDDGSKTLSWDAPSYTDPGDSAYAYVIYRSESPIDLNDMRAAQTVLIDKDNEFADNTLGSYYYGVTTLDRCKNESELYPIETPFVDLNSPEFAAEKIYPDTELSWSAEEGASQYLLELADNSSMTSPLIQQSISDTQQVVNLDFTTTYYWRVKADNSDLWSPLWSFTTQLAPQVELISPLADYSGTAIEPTLVWKSFDDASSYELEVSLSSSMADPEISLSNISDTTVELSTLEPTTKYYWHVRSNKYDRWSEVNSFTTKELHIETLWENTRIAQTYPEYLSSELSATSIAVGTYYGNNLVVLLQASDDSVRVVTLSAADGQIVNFTLNLDGVEGGTFLLSDMEFSEDGVIYASNCADKTETFKIYQWTDPLETPTVIYEQENVSYRTGDHITLKGRQDDNTLEIYAPLAKTNKVLKIGRESSTSTFVGTEISVDKNSYKSPSLAFSPGSSSFYLNSTSYYMRHFTEDGTFVDWMQGNDNMPVKANSIAAFEYDDNKYVVGYSQSEEAAYVVDVTTNLTDASFVGATYTMGTNTNDGSMGDVEVFERENGMFDLIVLGNQNGIGAYRFDATSIPTDVENIVETMDFELKANYPNPFNPITTIPYTMEYDAYVNIDIYDLRGRHIQTLYSANQQAGSHEVYFNAFNLGSGIYICKMKVDGEVLARKLTLVK